MSSVSTDDMGVPWISNRPEHGTQTMYMPDVAWLALAKELNLGVAPRNRHERRRAAAIARSKKRGVGRKRR